jgi:hypothetical protein
MTRDEAIEAIRTAGYDVSRSSTDESLYVALTSGDDEAFREICDRCAGLDVSWTGDGNTDGDGYTTDDVCVSGFSEPLRCADYDRGAPYARQTR